MCSALAFSVCVCSYCFCECFFSWVVLECFLWLFCECAFCDWLFWEGFCVIVFCAVFLCGQPRMRGEWEEKEVRWSRRRNDRNERWWEDGDKKRCDGEDVIMMMTTKNNQTQLNNWHCKIRKWAMETKEGQQADKENRKKRSVAYVRWRWRSTVSVLSFFLHYCGST